MYFFQGETETTHINGIVQAGAATRMSDRQFLARQIQQWKQSPSRQMQITGVKYAQGEQDILHHQRTAIGKGGKLEVVHNLPNARIVDNQYARMVAQKTDYLLGKPPTFDSEDKQYTAALQATFGAAFLRQLRLLGEDALNGGIGWLMPYYDEQGKFAFHRFEPYQILPFWQDSEHTKLDAAIYLYEVEAYEGETEKIVEHVEVFAPDGIYYYVYENGALTPEEPWHTPYVTLGAQELNWSQIPLVPWKANAAEIPLICRVKPLQDAINLMESAFENGMLEDPRNTILVVTNYDGTDLGELRRNLATYGAVKVRNGNLSLSILIQCNDSGYVKKSEKYSAFSVFDRWRRSVDVLLNSRSFYARRAKKAKCTHNHTIAFYRVIVGLSCNDMQLKKPDTVS